MKKSIYKSEIPLYFFLEAAINPADVELKITKEDSFTSADGSIIKTITGDVTLQSFEVLNWNGRTYPSDVVMDGLDRNPKIQNDMRMKQWAGEWGHPDTQIMTRMAQILPSMTSHYINSYYKKGILLKGSVTNAPFGYGLDMYNVAASGRPWAFSLRAFGGVDVNNVAIKPLTIITFDEVNRPSHKEAYGTSLMGIHLPDKYNNAMLKECSNSCIIEASTILEEVTKFVLDKSDNIYIAKELFGLNETVGIYDGNNCIILEGSYLGNKIKVAVPIETYIKDNYLDILKF